jgi:hypothetical protein
MHNKIQYIIRVDGFGTDMEYYHVSDDLEMVAERFVEDELEDGDLDDETVVEIFDSEMASLGIYIVSKEHLVRYYARKKRKGKK